MGEPEYLPDGRSSRPATPAWNRAEIDAAIAGLDQATQRFSSRINSLEENAHEMSHAPESPAPRPARGAPESAPEHPRESESSFDEQMRRAEREARMYLERAKQRADQLVNSMIGAVEQEAAEIRRDAEDGIRERWRIVEKEAGRYIDDARRVADGMVGERQLQIGRMSDGIVTRAESLTEGMHDAERVRHQFDDFVRALSRTADQISRAARRTEEGLPNIQTGRDSSPNDALAA